MSERQQFKAIVDTYTDYLVHEFVQFLDVPLFEGETFFNLFANGETKVLKDKLGINEEVFERLVGALVSVKAISIENGKLKRENVSFGGHEILKAASEVFGKNSSFYEDLPKLVKFFEHDLMASQLAQAGSLKDYLRDSIAYDMLVVRHFLSPLSTFKVLQSGASVADSVFKLSSRQIFDHYESKPKLLNVYGRGFASSHFLNDIDFVQKIKFQDSEQLVDVGGCFGNLGRIILENTDLNLTYHCLDLSGVLTAFGSEIKKFKSTFGDKFNFIKGDFFQKGDSIVGIEGRVFDKLFLGWILHDWNDDQCVQVLKNCATHMAPTSELFIFEILPNQRKMAFNFTDWLMLAMADGFERSLSQYEALFELAGLELIDTDVTSTGRSMMRLKVKHG